MTGDRNLPEGQAQGPGRERVFFIEQPLTRVRMRYESENAACFIYGASSSPARRTFPAVKITDFLGTVHIILSCVTKDEPYRQHPYKLVNPRECRNGVYCVTKRITAEDNEFEFHNLEMRCVAKNNIKDALRERQIKNIDPYKAGFSEHQLQKNEMKAIRLACQVFLCDHNGKARRMLRTVSDAIYNGGILRIKKASHSYGSAHGGDEVILLLCDAVAPNDVEVVFYESENSGWRALATDLSVHKNYTILFKTPPYSNPNITASVQVVFQLSRKSDQMISKPIAYVYIPNDQARPDLAVHQYLEDKSQKPLRPELFHGANNQAPSTSYDGQPTFMEVTNEPTPGTSYHSSIQDPALQLSPMQPSTMQSMHDEVSWSPYQPSTANEQPTLMEVTNEPTPGTSYQSSIQDSALQPSPMQPSPVQPFIHDEGSWSYQPSTANEQSLYMEELFPEFEPVVDNFVGGSQLALEDLDSIISTFSQYDSQTPLDGD